MSFLNSQASETLMYVQDEIWNTSRESIFTPKVDLTKTDSLFNISTKFNTSFTFSELKLRELHLKHFDAKTPKWEVVHNKSRFPRMIQTRSLLRDELEILKINMSMHDKVVALRQSEVLKNYQIETKQKMKKKIRKLSKKPILLLTKSVAPQIRDLLTEIEGSATLTAQVVFGVTSKLKSPKVERRLLILKSGSESAKTDKVIWKFLKRTPSFRRDYINSRKLFLKIQNLQLSAFRLLSLSCFQNAQPIKVTCPNCMFFITTHVKNISSVRAKLISVIFAIIGLCVVPYAFYAFKDIVHLCPLCEIYLGFCPVFNVRIKKNWSKFLDYDQIKLKEEVSKMKKKMVSASSTSAKNLFVESKLRLSDRVQVNVNNIAAIARQIQRGSKANENLMTAAKNFALQEAAIENSETNLKKLKLLTTHINNQLDSLHNNSAKMEMVLEQVRSMQR